MEKTDLIILVADKPFGLENASPKKIIKFFLDTQIEFDCLLLSNLFGVEFFVLKNFNTEKRHSGEWRRVFLLQGTPYVLGDLSFIFYKLNALSEQTVKINLSKYFKTLERRF
jgi:hypothetical protein